MLYNNNAISKTNAIKLLMSKYFDKNMTSDVLQTTSKDYMLHKIQYISFKFYFIFSSLLLFLRLNIHYLHSV